MLCDGRQVAAYLEDQARKLGNVVKSGLWGGVKDLQAVQVVQPLGL